MKMNLEDLRKTKAAKKQLDWILKDLRGLDKCLHSAWEKGVLEYITKGYTHPRKNIREAFKKAGRKWIQYPWNEPIPMRWPPKK